MKSYKIQCYIPLIFLLVILSLFACGKEKKQVESSEKTAQVAKASSENENKVVSFSDDVLPIFKSECSPCHIISAAHGLSLKSYDDVMAGSEHGKVVIEGNSAESSLVKYLIGELTPRMPLDREPLEDSDVKKIKDWIDAGAKNN
ncbi:hypothetical protein GF312_16125 [Candidatus Poribacteria bacterium]|nr:hypothetical protein [Candidatus Poribacteria bacterium]